MARVRLKVVVPAVLAGLLVFFGIGVAYLALRSPARGYADDFDSNLANTAPEVFQAAQADPVLHRLLLDKTQAAFLQGGWPAAQQVFRKIVEARIDAFAGDAAVLDCRDAWHDLFKALQATPHLCRQVIEQGDRGLPAGVADAAVERRARACDQMTRDGGRQRLAVDPPGHMDRDSFDAIGAKLEDSPKGLTAAQKEALNNSFGVAPKDDATLCGAELAFYDNYASMPAAQAASYERARNVVDSADFMYLPHPLSALQPGPPPDLHCAPAGTRFTLSLEDASTGRPVTWESLGQSKWACRVNNSLAGEQDAFADGADREGGRILHLLWPFQLGKTAYCHGVFGKATMLKVAAEGRFWLPWGSVDAFSIEETETGADGHVAYTITRYWAPSLGMLIGRKTDVYRGAWPQDADPDWQLVAMQVPVPPQATVPAPPSPSPLPKVIGPGYDSQNQ